MFVSYSHEDVQWVQRLKVFLKPLVESKRLRLWADTEIRAGDEWHPDIIRAIERSSTALLLVSADFLASDFVMKQELPALITQGVRLAPVLAGDCLWGHVPELKRVQWLHDPGRDGALNLVADQPGQRDRRLREICDRLIALTQAGRSGPIAAAPVVVDTAPVVAVHAGPGRAELFGVPALPPGYLARKELAAVIDAVMAVDGGAVGLTGTVPAVGLHGQGGIGKSVLAAAVARAEGIGRVFPDGVYWVTVGENADVLAVQLELLDRLGVRDRVPRTPAEALGQLREVLASRRVLLVVDDVWSDAAAQAFRATGRRGRVLYTSRDPQVLTAVGARRHQVDVLSPAAARELAAAILDVPPATLPAAADRALADVGHVALAVALLAAAVDGGRAWDAVAGDLRRDAGIFGDHPYANTFKAMQITVAVLPVELANALLSLAVFPSDIQVPIAAITRYWAHTRGRAAEQTAGDLDALAAANILGIDGDAVGFHDLQHDYLVLHAPTLALLHAGLLDAYRVLLPDHGRNHWWRLPADEPYIWDHLVQHLRGAGERRVLAAAVTDPAYLTRRIAMGGAHAAEADLGRAAVVLPTNDLIVWWRGWIARHAHLFTQGQGVEGNDRAAAVTPTMLAWLTVDSSLPEVVDLGRLAPLLPDPHLRVRWGLTSPDTALSRVLTGHTGGVQALAVAPDGSWLASASHDETVRIWDSATGTARQILTGHTDSVWALVVAPDGSWLASASGDGEVRIWDLATGTVRHTFPGHTGGVEALVVAPDGSWLATPSGGDAVRIWDPTTGSARHTLTGHTNPVWALAVAPDGSWLASASGDGEVRIWDPTTGVAGHTLTGHTGEVALAVAPDGSWLASASGDDFFTGGVVRIWDPITGTIRHTLTGRSDGVRALVVAPDGSWLASAGSDQEVRIWNPTACVADHTLTGHPGVVVALAVPPDGSWLASADSDEEVVIWDPITGAVRHTLTGHTSEMVALPVAPDRFWLAFNDGTVVRIWDPTTGTAGHTLTGHTGGVEALVVAPDGSWLASADSDDEVRIWDPITGTARHTLTGYTSSVTALAVASDGSWLASAGSDEDVWIWDPITGVPCYTLTGHTDEVAALAVAPDGSWLASAGHDKTVRIWDPNTGTARHTLTGHTGGVRALAVAPDGSWVASADNDGDVRIWDPITGTPLTSLRVEGRLFHLLAASTTIAAAGERGPYFLALCPGAQSA